MVKIQRGPLDEKNIFSTTFLDLVENRLKWLEMLCWFQKHVDQYIFDIWCHQMTSAVIRCHVMSYDDIQCHKVHWYICFWNQHRVSDRLSLIWIKSENVVEKIFFSSKGPPFGFWPFSGHFKIFASRCHSLKIELEGWNFQRMSQICQIITVSICEANVQLLL